MVYITLIYYYFFVSIFITKYSRFTFFSLSWTDSLYRHFLLKCCIPHNIYLFYKFYIVPSLLGWLIQPAEGGWLEWVVNGGNLWGSWKETEILCPNSPFPIGRGTWWDPVNVMGMERDADRKGFRRLSLDKIREGNFGAATSDRLGLCFNILNNIYNRSIMRTPIFLFLMKTD